MKKTRYAMLQNIRRNALRIALLADTLEEHLEKIDTNPDDVKNRMRASSIVHNIWMSSSAINQTDCFGKIASENPDFTKWAMHTVSDIDYIIKYNEQYAPDIVGMPVIPVSEEMLEAEYQNKVVDSLPDLPELEQEDIPPMSNEKIDSQLALSSWVQSDIHSYTINGGQNWIEDTKD